MKVKLHSFLSEVCVRHFLVYVMNLCVCINILKKPVSSFMERV